MAATSNEFSASAYTHLCTPEEAYRAVLALPGVVAACPANVIISVNVQDSGAMTYEAYYLGFEQRLGGPPLYTAAQDGRPLVDASGAAVPFGAAFADYMANANYPQPRRDLARVARTFMSRVDCGGVRAACAPLLTAVAAIADRGSRIAAAREELARIRNILEQRAAGPALVLISYGYRGGSATCFPLHHFLLSGRDAAGDWRPRPPRPWSELAAEEQAVVRDALRQPSDDDAGWEFRTDFRELPAAEYDSAALQAAAMVREETLRSAATEAETRATRLMAAAAERLLATLDAAQQDAQAADALLNVQDTATGARAAAPAGRAPGRSRAVRAEGQAAEAAAASAAAAAAAARRVPKPPQLSPTAGARDEGLEEGVEEEDEDEEEEEAVDAEALAGGGADKAGEVEAPRRGPDEPYTLETYPWRSRTRSRRCAGCAKNKLVCGMPFSFGTCAFYPRVCRYTTPCDGPCSCAHVQRMSNELAKRLGLKQQRGPPGSGRRQSGKRKPKRAGSAQRAKRGRAASADE